MAWETKEKHKTRQDVLGMHMIESINPMIFFSNSDKHWGINL